VVQIPLMVNYKFDPDFNVNFRTPPHSRRSASLFIGASFNEENSDTNCKSGPGISRDCFRRLTRAAKIGVRSRSINVDDLCLVRFASQPRTRRA
jgi:hypothetical protein